MVDRREQLQSLTSELETQGVDIQAMVYDILKSGRRSNNFSQLENWKPKAYDGYGRDMVTLDGTLGPKFGLEELKWGLERSINIKGFEGLDGNKSPSLKFVVYPSFTDDKFDPNETRLIILTSQQAAEIHQVITNYEYLKNNS